MNKFIEKNLSALLLAITCYFLFSVSNSLKETSKYNSDLRACAKMKAYINDKDKS